MNSATAREDGSTTLFVLLFALSTPAHAEQSIPKVVWNPLTMFW